MTDTELITFVRFWIGNLPISEISDSDMTVIITMVRSQYPAANDCELKYYATKNVLEWLIRKDNQASSGTNATGAVTKRVEEINTRRIEVTYDSSGETATAGGYQDILDMLEADPTTLGCRPFESTMNTGTIIVGGTSQAQYDKVKRNPDSRTGYSMGNLHRQRNRVWR